MSTAFTGIKDVQFRGLDLLPNEGYKPLQTRYIPIEIPSQK